MPHYIERTERFGTFGASNPRLTQAVEERPEGGGRTSKHLYRQVEIEIHSLSRPPNVGGQRRAHASPLATPG